MAPPPPPPRDGSEGKESRWVMEGEGGLTKKKATQVCVGFFCKLRSMGAGQPPPFSCPPLAFAYAPPLPRPPLLGNFFKPGPRIDWCNNKKRDTCESAYCLARFAREGGGRCWW